MGRVAKCFPSVALGAYGLKPAEVWVSTTGLTHRIRCSSARNHRRHLDTDRRDLVGMVWCRKCCLDLVNDSGGHPDDLARHHPGCTVSDPGPRYAQAWDLDGLGIELQVCGECHAQSLVVLDHATGPTS